MDLGAGKPPGDGAALPPRRMDELPGERRVGRGEERKRVMRIKSGMLTLGIAVAVGFGVVPLQAQRGGGFGGRAAGPRAGQNLDVILEHQEALELTQDQSARIRELKAVMEADVLPVAEEIRALREQIRTGEVEREEGYRALQTLRGELLTASAPLRGRIQEILTVEQHGKLQEIVWESRPGRGQGGVLQGHGGGRMPRGQMRGGRGGLGTRQGPNGQGWGRAHGFRHPARGGAFGPRGPGGFGSSAVGGTLPAGA
jgi:hypothetical protein